MRYYTQADVLRLGRDDAGPLPAVFGPDRPTAAQELAAILSGMRPTEDERLRAALGAGGEARIRAYDRAVTFLRSAYGEYGFLAA